jgi:hypothetical protein
MSHAAVTWIFGAAGPWLVLLITVQHLIDWRSRILRGWPLLILSGVVALGILLIPVERMAIARWVGSLSPSFSIPLTGLLAIAAWERAFGRELLAQSDRSSAWAFGAIGGLALYPFALGVGRIDPYEWGWRSSPLFVAVAALTAWLIWKQNRFGYLLLLAAIAFHLRVFESSNYWDYLLDPVYWLTSLVVWLRRGLLLRRGARTPVPAASR